MFILFLIITICLYLYYVMRKKLTYWKMRGLPQYNIVQILKEDIDAVTKNQTITEIFIKHYQTFSNKRYFGLYQLFHKTLVVRDIELIKEMTVKNFNHFVDHGLLHTNSDPLWDNNMFALEGQAWKDMRVILSPAFTTRKLKIMFEMILNCIEQFVNHLEVQLKDQTCVTLEMEDAFNRYASDVIASVAYGYHCDSFKTPENEFFVKSNLATQAHSSSGALKIFVMCYVPKIAKMFGLKFFPKTVSALYLNIITDNVKTREKKGIVREDIINLLMEARNCKLNKNNLTDVDIAAQALLLYFAGVETVSTTLSFTSYELATHPAVQKRLQQEIDEILESCKGGITFDGLKKMKYLDMVLLESLRKWPPSIVTDRICTKPYVIQPMSDGEAPVHLKKGDFIWIPIYSIHRDSNLYPDPDEFNPERFNVKNQSNINLSFGIGPRGCVAKRFAMIEMKLLFFQILSKFDIVTVDKTTIPLKLAKLPKRLAIKGGNWLGLKVRNKTNCKLLQ